MLKKLLAKHVRMDIKQEVLRQQGLIFFNNMSMAQLVTVINGAVVAYIFGSSAQPAFIVIWLSSLFLLSLTRLLTAKAFVKRVSTLTATELQLWIKWACVGALLAGILWAVGCAVFMQGDSLVRVFVVMISAGMIAGATTTLSNILVAFFLYMIPILSAILLSLIFTWRGHDDSVLMLVSLLFTIIVTQSARRFYHSLTESIRLTLEMKNNQVQLQQAANVFLHTTEGIVITDIHGHVLDVNNAFTQITGYSHTEIIDRPPPISRTDCQGKQAYRSMLAALLSRGEWSGEVWGRRKNRAPFAAMLSVSAVRDEAGHVLHYVGLFSDISALKAHELELKRIAHYDMLTGLPNRALLTDRLDQALADSQRLKSGMAIVYLDLDGFKTVNDQWGHDVGDQLLVAVSRRMQHVLRQGDTLARLGGDEFVAILTNIKLAEHAETVLERLLQAAAKPVIVQDHTLQVTASIGVTLYPQDISDAEQLLRHADQAMYQAKQAGKNRIQWYEA